MNFNRNYQNFFFFFQKRKKIEFKKFLIAKKFAFFGIIKKKNINENCNKKISKDIVRCEIAD